jgi:hypothetical protein
MNCRKGDLALVILGLPNNCGKVVTCLELLPPGSCNVEAAAGALWRIDRPLEFEGEFGVIEGSLAPDWALLPIGEGRPSKSAEDRQLFSETRYEPRVGDETPGSMVGQGAASAAIPAFPEAV